MGPPWVIESMKPPCPEVERLAYPGNRMVSQPVPPALAGASTAGRGAARIAPAARAGGPFARRPRCHPPRLRHAGGQRRQPAVGLNDARSEWATCDAVRRDDVWRLD